MITDPHTIIVRVHPSGPAPAGVDGKRWNIPWRKEMVLLPGGLFVATATGRYEDDAEVYEVRP